MSTIPKAPQPNGTDRMFDELEDLEREHFDHALFRRDIAEAAASKARLKAREFDAEAELWMAEDEFNEASDLAEFAEKHAEDPEYESTDFRQTELYRFQVQEAQRRYRAIKARHDDAPPFMVLCSPTTSGFTLPGSPGGDRSATLAAWPATSGRAALDGSPALERVPRARTTQTHHLNS